MMPNETAENPEEKERRQARVTTVLPIVRLALLTLIGSIFSLVALSALGVDTTPVMAGAGILGLAVSLGSQALVKDVISGIFWMLDDAFRLGEDIEVDSIKGRVEQIQIRSFRLRGEDDRLHTIPYGQITTVASRSRGLVQARIAITLLEPPGPARQDRLVRKASAVLRSETALRDVIVGKITLHPSDADASESDVVLKVSLARPASGSAVPLIRSLLMEALDQAGFELAGGGIRISLDEPSDNRPFQQPSVVRESTP